MKKTALIVMLITIVSKIFGFGREVALSYFYGASNISDAYIISITIPAVIFSFIAGGLGAGYIPMYSRIQKNKGEIEADNFTNNLINALLLICTIIVFVSLIFTNQIVQVFASGFTGETLIVAVKFTRITLIAIYFTGIVSVLSGYLQIKGNYIAPALVGIPLSLFVVLSIVLSSYTNLLVLPLGYVIAIAAQVLLVIPYKCKYRYKFSLQLKDKHIIEMGYMLIPIIIGVSVNQINMLVDRTLASRIVVGGISAMNYAERLNGFIQGIFVLSIATVVYPTLSKLVAEKNMFGLKKHLSGAITGINILVLPATIGSMLFAAPIISLLFGRGAFDEQALNMTSYALFFYSIGMTAFGLRNILTRAFYSMEDTKSPMINASIGMVINILLNLILSKYLGIGGLALATSIAAIVTTTLLFISLRKKIGPFGMKQISISFLKILFASLVMGLLAKLSFNYLMATLSQNLSLLLAIGVGAVSYFVIIYFMKIEDVDVIVGAIKKKLGRGTAKG